MIEDITMCFVSLMLHFSLKNDGIQDAHPVLVVLKKVMLHGTIWNNNF